MPDPIAPAVTPDPTPAPAAVITPAVTPPAIAVPAVVAAPPAVPPTTPPAVPAGEGWADPSLPAGYEQNAELNTLMKGLGLTAKQGQALANYYLANEANAAKESDAQAQQRAAEFVTRMEAEAKADPDIGGAKWAESQALAQKAIAAGVVTKEFVEMLTASKMIHHKHTVAQLRNLGRMLSEDRVGGTLQVAPAQKPFFDHPTSQALHAQGRR